MMKDKLNRSKLNRFDRCARKLGVIGCIILLSSVALGISMIVTLNRQNESLIQEVSRNEKVLDNLQLQNENGNAWMID